MKKKTSCTWDTIKESIKWEHLPDFMLEYSFFLNLEENNIALSPALANQIFHKNAPTDCLPFPEGLTDYISSSSLTRMKEEIHRLSQGDTLRTDLQIDLRSENRTIPVLCIMAKLKNRPVIFALVHLAYELMHEYQENLNQVIDKLEKAQTINQLILEGSTDYVYQLDLVKNVCTFSPKSLDVLPLESNTFSNAMDTLLTLIHPEDRHVFLDSFTPFLTGKSLYHTAEYRVITKFGDIMWISCHGKGLLDDQGHPLFIAGSLMDITEMKEADYKIKKMLYTDTLTGLKSLRCFELEMAEHLKKPEATGSILCIDIHDFKLYNEIFGHNFGNKILKEFANILRFYYPNVLGLYRLEGDEFLVHLDKSDRDSILSSLAPLQLALTKARVIEGHNIYIDITVGVAIYPEHGKSPEELLKNADTVLYKMSKYSTEKVMFYINDNGEYLSKRYNLEHELRGDIDANFRHFRVVYQPITKLSPQGNFWCSAEALLRYDNPDMPDVTQQELIETLEMSDMIIPVGRWVLTKAIEECSHWNCSGNDVSIHVNFSAQQMSDAGILQHITSTLDKYGLPAKNLICELTETSLIDNFESATRLCRELMNLGVGIALDDFGTGYTSFNHLRNLPISQIKIDRTYVQNLTENEYNRIIIKCLYDLSRNMGIELCIEGVETKEILDILVDMGATLIQGFYFGLPMEADIIRRDFQQNHHLLPS